MKKLLGILMLFVLLSVGCNPSEEKAQRVRPEAKKVQTQVEQIEEGLSLLAFIANVAPSIEGLSSEELQALAEKTRAQIITYPLNASPAASDQLLGMDDPDGSWSVMRLTIQRIMDLATASYGPGTTATPSIIFYDSDAEGADDADEEAAKIAVNMVTTTEDAEDGVKEFQVMVNGSMETSIELDGENDRVELKKPTIFESTATLLSSNADPTAAGMIQHDSTVTNYTNGALRYYDGVNIRHAISMVAATAEGCTDDQVSAYDAAADLWYCKTEVVPESIVTDGTPASSGSYKGFIVTDVDAGEAVTAGDIVYMDGTSNEWMLADANAAGEFPALGMAAENGTDGNPMDVLIRGVARLDSWSWTNEGVVLYLSETPGGMVEVASIPSDDGDCVQILATVLAITNDTILFNADSTWFLDDGS